MGFITTALTFFAAGADTVGIGQFVAGLLRKEGQSAEQLFTACFTRAVNRSRPKLGRLTEAKDPDSVSIDVELLSAAVETASKELDVKNLGSHTVTLFDDLSPLFRDVIILPGNQLIDRQLDQHVSALLGDAFADFFTRLPAYPRAVAESELSHIVRSDDAHLSHSQSLDSIQQTLAVMLQRQDDVLKKLPYLDPAVIQQESTRPEFKNPFRIVKAEDFNHDYDRLAALFKEPSIYDDLKGPDNLIIAGGRGCGKSMLLRSLSALTAMQLQRLRAHSKIGAKAMTLTWKDSRLDYFGVYIKLARGYFHEWSPDCKLTPDAATHLFQHVFNMLLLRALIEGVIEARDNAVLKVEQHVEQGIVRDISDFAGFELTTYTFVSLLGHTRREERMVGDHIGALRLGVGSAEYKGAHTGIHDFIAYCCRSVLNTVPELSKCRIFFLLDEYENLAEFQQRVVNTLAKLRPLSLSLKVATRALGVKSVVDLQGEPIQRPRDYHVVELDYDPNDARYRQLLFDIASKRLEAEGFSTTDVNDLLQQAPRYHPSNEDDILKALDTLLQHSGKRLADLDTQAQREKMHHWSVALVFRLCRDRRQPFTYAGFDDFVDLSSGIISSFLEFCKLAFYLAQAEGVNVRAGTAISWSIQNEAVYTASRAYFDYIERNVPDTGAAISRIVLDLADIFREKLMHHGSEPEAARLIVRDPGTLDGDEFKRLAAVLDDAVRWSVFHAVGQASAYFPKHKTEVRSDDYLLNRVLAPILRISPRPRWSCRFAAKELAALAEQDTRSASRNSLRQKHRGGSSDASSAEEHPLFADPRHE